MTMIKKRPKLIFFVAVDWFFCSHFLARAIAAHEAGYDVLVLTNVNRHEDVIRTAGLRLVHLPINRRSLNPFGALLTLLRIVRVYLREQPDIIHHVAFKPILLGSLAARISGCYRIVNAVVGGGYVFTSQYAIVRILRPLLTLSLRLFLNPHGSRVVFENSDDLKSFTEAGLVRLDDTVLIRGAGVDPNQFVLTNHTHGLPLVILVARLLWDKGIGEFVEAAVTLRNRGVKARFVIVGEPDGDNRASIDFATLEAWTVEGGVELWGFRHDIPKVLAEATIACLPSYREGLPKALLEAMAAGLPCVTTDVPGCREAVLNGENGLLVPPRDVFALANALEILLNNPDLARKMGQRGRQRLELEFSTEHVNASTLKLYREILVNDGIGKKMY